MCGNSRSYVPNSLFLGRENETIAESLNPPASAAASSTYQRATAVLASSFPIMGPVSITQIWDVSGSGSQGSRVHLDGLLPLRMVGALSEAAKLPSLHSLCSMGLFHYPGLAARASWSSLYFSKQRNCPPMLPTAQGSSAH